MKRSIQFSFGTGPAPPKVQVIGLSLVATILALAATWTAVVAYDLETNGAQAVATIVALEGNGKNVYPVFNFSDNQGRRHTVRASFTSGDYVIGDTLDILYPLDTPLKARINTWLSLYFLPLLFGGMSAVFFAVAGIFLRLKPFFAEDFAARLGKVVTTKVSPDGSVTQSTRSSAPLLKWLSRIFGVAAIVALCAVSWTGWHSYELLRDGVETRGIVTKLARIGATHKPWFQFTDSVGEIQIIESYRTSNDYLLGDEVRVIYFPNDPQKARIKSRMAFISFPIYFGILGALFLLIRLVLRNQLRLIESN